MIGFEVKGSNLLYLSKRKVMIGFEVQAGWIYMNKESLFD